MKTTIGWTASFLLLVACGRTPTEEDSATGTGTASATDTEATGTQPSTGNSGVSDSETNTPTDTGGSVSNSQTDTGETTATATTSPVTVTDTEPDPTVTVSTTESTGPGDTSVGDTSSSSESMSVGESSGSSSGSSVGETTSTTSGETTSTTSDDTTSTTSDDTTSGTTGMDVQCGLQLNVTIRDFLFSHPDMEDYCCGQVNGLVQPDLGPNGKPVFAMVGNPKMLTDAPTFDQWYTDVNGVNQKTMIVIDLMEIMPGVYSYQNNSFFPVDNILWGNEGQPHNFHFTTEIHAQFQYFGGETFQFSGDDDVWVFINKKLVIDLGGVHGAQSKMVALDGLGLTLGQNYPLDVFHAERHTVQSNFRIDTTICSAPQ